jgi:hypothetical protein
MTTPANTSSASSVAATWSDNMAVATFLAALGQSADTTATHAQQAGGSQQFWATPERAADSPYIEVLEISLASARLVNQLDFDVAIFPQIVSVEYADPNLGSWTACLNVNDSPSPATQSILTSYPQVLPPVSSVTGHVHPQHSYSGHWQSLQFNIWPVTTQKLRVLLRRTTQGTPPMSTLGKPIPYSLAVRNLYVGYQVASKKDIPTSQPVSDSNTQYEPFSSVTDILGSLVQFSVRVNAAKNILRNSSSESVSVVWKSEPQPFPWAVVNFYADTRDALGSPQVIDRFYVEPLYNGPSCHLYWSNDDPTSDFVSPKDPLPYPVAVVQDPNGVGGDILHSGAAGKDLIGFVDIDNTGVSFDPSHSWWIGFDLNFKFNHGQENAGHPIFDCGAFSITMTPYGFRVSTAYGDYLLVDVDPFGATTPLTCAVGYDGTSITLYAEVLGRSYTGSLTLSQPLISGTVSTLRIGGYQASSPMVGNFDLNYFVLKTDIELTSSIATDFLADPAPYVDVEQFAVQHDTRSDNALLRYEAGWATQQYQSGFVGGTPDRFGELVWNPISRDFVLQKGFFEIPPTQAKYWKFEFCALVAEPYEIYVPVDRVVQTFSSSMWATSLTTKTTTITAGQGIFSTYPINVALLAQFDSGQTAQAGSGAASLGLQPTTARVITDPISQQKVGSIYWAWNFMPVASSVIATPIFTKAQSHTYEEINVQQQSKISYFVGLISLTAYRVDSLATDDTMRYVDNFYDMTNIAKNTNWTQTDDGHLSSGAAYFSEITSRPFSSSRIVTAVQLAAQCSDPMQLLPDADFDDTTHANWTMVGDANPDPMVITDLGIGSVIRLSRSTPALTWALAETTYPQWSDLNAANITFAQLAAGFQNPQDLGGISSAPVDTPAGGRVAVAGRVVSADDLTQPLWVQIVDDTTGLVLSEEQVTVRAHQITEWYTMHTIGDLTARPWTWDDFTANTKYPSMVDTFAGVNSTILPPMGTGQSWSYAFDGSGNPLSLAIVSNQASVTATGQYSYVDARTPWGTLQFTVGTVPANPATDQVGSGQPGVAGWSTLFNTQTSWQSGGPLSGDHDIKMIYNGAGAPVDIGIQTTSKITGYTAGQQVAFSADVMAYQNSTVNLTASWYNSSNTLIGTTNATLTATANTWQTIHSAHTVPVGADRAVFSPHIPGLLSGGFEATNIFVGTPSERAMVVFPPFFLDDAGTLNDWAGNVLSSSVGAPMNILTAAGTARAVQANDSIRIDIMPTTMVPSGKGDTSRASNPDPVVWPYSLVVYLNGTWVRTYTHNIGAQTILGLAGHVGQTFADFLFTPFNYGPIPGPVIDGYPRLDRGEWLDPSNQTQFLDNNGNTWNSPVGLSWDLSTPPEIPGSDNIGPPLTALADGAVLWTDTEYWYGALTAYVRKVATDGSGTPRGYVLCLDYDNQVFLDYQGNIVKSGTSYGTLIPGGIPDNSRVSVVFARTSQVTSTTRGSVNPSFYPDILVGILNGQIVGTYAQTTLQQWRGTKRGLAGDVYSGTTAPTPDYLGATSFRSFHWAPDASLVPANPASQTWDQITHHNTVTYDQATRFSQLPIPRLRAQLVQYGQSEDTWDIDTLSMFVDPLVWSVSNDGGTTFYDVFDILNNAHGVFSFPSSVEASTLGVQPGTSLVWKVRSYAPDRLISSLVIRPWYAGPLSGITRTVGLGVSGPNLMPYDHLMPIDQDPAFQNWSKPIPREWWYQFRQLIS